MKFTLSLAARMHMRPCADARKLTLSFSSVQIQVAGTLQWHSLLPITGPSIHLKHNLTSFTHSFTGAVIAFLYSLAWNSNGGAMLLYEQVLNTVLDLPDGLTAALRDEIHGQMLATPVWEVSRSTKGTGSKLSHGTMP